MRDIIKMMTLVPDNNIKLGQGLCLFLLKSGLINGQRGGGVQKRFGFLPKSLEKRQPAS